MSRWTASQRILIGSANLSYCLGNFVVDATRGMFPRFFFCSSRDLAQLNSLTLVANSQTFMNRAKSNSCNFFVRPQTVVVFEEGLGFFLALKIPFSCNRLRCTTSQMLKKCLNRNGESSLTTF